MNYIGKRYKVEQVTPGNMDRTVGRVFVGNEYRGICNRKGRGKR